LFIVAAAAAWLLLVLGTPAALAAGRIDRDGDKIYDDLERTLATKSASDAVDVIVVLDGLASAERVLRLERDVGGFSTKQRFTIVDAFAARMTKGKVAALSRRADVVQIEEDVPIRALNDTAQASFGVTTARVDAGVDGDGDGSPSTYSRDDLVAAVLDTGIDAAHRDLDGGKVLAFVNCANRSTCVPAAPSDANGHGTHVAATIAGDGEARADRLHRGVAPGAALVGARVLDANGEGSTSNAISALQWLRDNRAAYGIDVVNLSVGSIGCSNGSDSSSAAVNATQAAGLVVVVSAGNEGPQACSIGSPAAAANAITVGAMADLGELGFSLASFSSRGPTADGRVKPDLVGPGVNITSARAGSGTGYVTYDGTSMAAPFVAGVALLMRDANPSLTANDVKARLLSTALDWGASGTDPEYGAGRLDAYDAIRAAGAPISAPPAVPVHHVRQATILGTGGSVDFPVSVAEGGFPLAATLVAPGWSSSTQTPDFDLLLLDTAGTVVARRETAAIADWPARRRQEQLAVPAPPIGSYTLRVVSAAGGGSFVLDVSGALAAAPPAPVPPPPPVSRFAPAVSGIAEEGRALVAASGGWTGTNPISFAYRWRRCDAGGNACADVPGAVQTTYVLTAGDVGRTLRVVVTATDVGGSTSAVSAATAVVARAPDRTAPSARALASSGKRGTRIRLLYRASDDRGRTRERVQVYRGTKLLKRIDTRLQARQAGRTYGVAWRAPSRPERLRFCVRAWDAAGNASVRSCAALRIT
jgi:serine protease AprX